ADQAGLRRQERSHLHARAHRRSVERRWRPRRGVSGENGMNTPATAWNRKHLLDIESLSVEEIHAVHATARAFKAVGERAIKKVPALRGKTVVNLFIEPSTRTRISFELAAM